MKNGILNLKRCLPSDRLAKENNRFDPRKVVLKGAGRRPPPLVVHGVQGGEGVAQLIHGGDPLEPEAAGNVLHRALPRHQHMLLVELGEHPQRGVCHHNLQH